MERITRSGTFRHRSRSLSRSRSRSRTRSLSRSRRRSRSASRKPSRRHRVPKEVQLETKRPQQPDSTPTIMQKFWLKLENFWNCNTDTSLCGGGRFGAAAPREAKCDDTWNYDRGDMPSLVSTFADDLQSSSDESTLLGKYFIECGSIRKPKDRRSERDQFNWVPGPQGEMLLLDESKISGDGSTCSASIPKAVWL